MKLKKSSLSLSIFFLLTLAKTSSAQEAGASVSVKKAVLDIDGQTIPKGSKCVITAAWKTGDFWNNTHIIPDNDDDIEGGGDIVELAFFRRSTEDYHVLFFPKAEDDQDETLTVSTRYALQFDHFGEYWIYDVQDDSDKVPKIIYNAQSKSYAGTFRIEEIEKTEENQDHRYKLFYDSKVHGSNEIGLERIIDLNSFYVTLIVGDTTGEDGDLGKYTLHHLDFWFTDCVA